MGALMTVSSLSLDAALVQRWSFNAPSGPAPDGTVIATVINISGNTYRYLLSTRTGVDPKETFVAGDINVQVVAGSWRAGSGADRCTASPSR